MKVTKLGKFAIAIALQVLIIFAIIIVKLSILSGGTEVLLRIAPLDPTSPLRGDYVTFRYDISNISQYKVDDDVKVGDILYVFLRQEGKYWEAEEAQLDKPINTNQIFIKGRVSDGGLRGEAIHVLYGVEEYFIPEGKGRNFNFWNREASAGIVVDEDGNAVLKRIYIDDKPWP